MDPGTAFEIGYAEARGKRIFLWSDDPRTVAERVAPAPDNAERDGDGHLIENFGKAENLMIVRDGACVWPSAEGAIKEAAATLAHAAKNRQLQMTTRRSVLIAVAISLAVAVGAGWVVNRLVGW
jgi:nucleoside 2-deoxyribosyltransferase